VILRQEFKPQIVLIKFYEMRGSALLETRLRDETTADSEISRMQFEYPVRLIPARIENKLCAVAFIMSFGGGLVGGDTIKISLSIGKGSGLLLLSQASTKVFKSKELVNCPSSQNINATIESGAILCLLPEPVTPFRDSRYSQTQVFDICTGGTNGSIGSWNKWGSLLALDWITSGRMSRFDL
jgi:urease accessory protein